jgi:small-conductance mechanosensitive channel
MNLVTPLERLNWTNSPAWVLLIVKLTGIVFILVSGWALWRISEKLIRAFQERAKIAAKSIEDQKQIETLARALHYVVSVILALLVGMTTLAELGISIAPILATAGIAGVAVGFGAQSLVKDYFTGLVILLENQIRQGDVVDVAGKSGVVEELTLRYVRLRDYEGAVHYIPNSSIETVTNRSRIFAFAVMDIGVAYKENTDRVTSIMKEVGEKLRSLPEYSSKILEPLEVAGVDRWADSSVVIKCRFKVVALEQWAVRRGYLDLLKKAFEEEKVEIPFPHVTLVSGGPGTSPSKDS